MRPIRRDTSPEADDYDDYTKAKPALIGRLGSYCSYCERPIKTNLAVEHIQPKAGDDGHPELIGRWTNFLLACVNCNSTKKDKKVDLDKLLIPDRDNTFSSFQYTEDGKVSVSEALATPISGYAKATLELVGLDKKILRALDANGVQVEIDRVSQRMQAWAKAQSAEAMIQQQPQNDLLKEMAIGWAVSEGFFSIWLTVFADCPDMKLKLVRAFKGTEESGCFDMTTGDSVTPAPNPDVLAHGGKV
ncbi:HNH endonuclease [Vibrio ouci]|uniref:HNH endonuclease n=1 Tax=Vibrio ouci TaxID=2499078 RepID=A0A4Y8WBI0_9VIBR|nr:HNH endonuclease [Vibrio ouci]TFH89983.1 HNH endonuclease [Vibrio ouci]